jgi:hypothetical protein
MKIRNGFVTNSSSSSFIIAYKPFPELEIDIINKYPFLKTYLQLIEKFLDIRGDSDTRPASRYRTKEQWTKHLVNENYYKDVDELLEDYDKELYYETLSYLEKGYVICEKRIDYNNDLLVELFKELEDKEHFIILDKVY